MAYRVQLPPVAGSPISEKPVRPVRSGKGSPSLPQLDPVAVREILGDHPAPEAVQALQAEVGEALARLDAEIRSGQFTPGLRLVRGRPLGDFLPLDEVARLLRAWQCRGTP